MFVGCVVAGSVMLVCQGAKVRGALIRDVAAYAIAVLSVALILWSGKVRCIPSLHRYQSKEGSYWRQHPAFFACLCCLNHTCLHQSGRAGL